MCIYKYRGERSTLYMTKQRNFIKQQQVQKQKLSHQNIQLFKMMELNLLQFDQKLKEELDLNPALENISNIESSHEVSLDKIAQDAYTSSSENAPIPEHKIDISRMRDHSSSLHNAKYARSEDEDRELFIPVEDNESIIDSLINQLKYTNISEKQLLIGEFIIGNLDDDGYLRRPISSIVDDLSFRQNISTDEAEVNRVLHIIQKLDPAGIAATNLQECLLLQLQKKKSSHITQLARIVVTDYFELFSKKQFERIAKKMKISDEEFELVHREIVALNPRPTEKNPNENALGIYIIPDFVVYREDHKLELELHSYNQPNLSISPDFADMLKRLKEEKKKSKSEKDAMEYISDKINKAHLFISLVKERQETMIIVMSKILQFQRKFFLTGEESDLVPMVLRNIADVTGFDVSTISRVTNSKYVQTEYGIFSLKFFFSEGVANEEGDVISNRSIMKQLEDIVSNEDKSNPLSDDQITAELKKLGMNIARRTTAKYRENLNIPPKHLRKIITKS